MGLAELNVNGEAVTSLATLALCTSAPINSLHLLLSIASSRDSNNAMCYYIN